MNRSGILFITGLLGIGHETLLEHSERPTLLVLFAAMIGLPAFLSPSISGNYGFEHSKKAQNEDEGKPTDNDQESE